MMLFFLGVLIGCACTVGAVAFWLLWKWKL